MTKNNQIKFDATNPSEPKNAIFSFTLASLAYKSPSEIEEELRKIEFGGTNPVFFKSGLTAGFIVEKDDVIAVSFRGSSNWKEWLNNCKIWMKRTEYGRVHSGFWTTIEQISPNILELILPRLRPEVSLVFTGHSRGGVLAALFQFMFNRHASLNELGPYIVAVHTFGSPRYCDSEFAASMSGDVAKERSSKTPIQNLLQLLLDFGINVYSFAATFIWLLHFVFIRRMQGIEHHSISSHEKSLLSWVAWAPFLRRMHAAAEGNDLSNEEEETIRGRLGGTETTFITKEKLQIEKQPWEQRRLATRKIIQRLIADAPDAQKEFDTLLTEFETSPFSRTPLENMEILSVFYVPKDGFEKCMPAVVANAVLGWYDALRFASASGRAEIIHNQGFFKMPITLGGKNSDVANFLRNNPDKIAKSLELGFLLADKFRETSEYERNWPSAFGLEPMSVALGGTFQEIPALPKDQWDSAWDKAKQRISAYYQISTSKSDTKIGSANRATMINFVN